MIERPILRADLPLYPPTQQVVRVTNATVPGPSGYASSSVLGPSIYIGFVQQLHPTTLLPRDREPCFVLDLNRLGLAPGYYDSRLSGSYQSLPVYQVGGAAINPILSSSIASVLTPAQIEALSTLSVSQLALLSNLNVCQLDTLLDALPTSQLHTITSGVLTVTQISNLINYLTSSQLTSIYNLLTTSQIITLTSTLNQQQVQTLVQSLTATQIQTLISNLTSTQLQVLSGMSSQQIETLYNNLTTTQLQTFLNVNPLPTILPTGSVNEQTGTSYTFQYSDLGKLVVFENASSISGTLPSPSTVGDGWMTTIWNGGSGTLTLTPASGTINGSANFAVSSSTGTTVYSDGSEYHVASGGAGVTSGSSLTQGVVAATGSVQGDAASLLYNTNSVTGADTTKGVILLNTIPYVAVRNSDVMTLNVYPPSGESIGVLATNASDSISGANAKLYIRFAETPGKWNSVLLN